MVINPQKTKTTKDNPEIETSTQDLVSDFVEKSDVFGEALYGYLNGDSSTYSIIWRNNTHIDDIDTSVFFNSYLGWEDYEKNILLKNIKGKVLDIGAGAGRHALFLQKKGFDVQAIDNSPGAVQIMKIRGVKNVQLADMRDLPFPGNSFNSVLIMFSDLGIAGSIKDTKQLLKNLYKMTTEKGRIILALRDPFSLRQSQYFIPHNHKRKGAKIVDKLRIRIKYNSSIGDWFYLLMASPKELKGLIKKTGWTVSQIEKGKDGFYGAVLEKEEIV